MYGLSISFLLHFCQFVGICLIQPYYLLFSSGISPSINCRIIFGLVFDEFSFFQTILFCSWIASLFYCLLAPFDRFLIMRHVNVNPKKYFLRNLYEVWIWTSSLIFYLFTKFWSHNMFWLFQPSVLILENLILKPVYNYKWRRACRFSKVSCSLFRISCFSYSFFSWSYWM